MPLLVSQVLEEARDAHPAFGERWTPDPLVFRFLGRYQRTLVSRVAFLNPDVLQATETVPLPLAAFDDGHPLPAAHYYRRGRAIYAATGLNADPLHLVPWETRPYNRLFPAASIVAGVLYLIGAAGDWTQFSELEVYYVPIPAVGLTGASVLVLPDSAHPCVVGALTDFLAGRAAAIKDAPKVDVGRYRSDMQMAERELLREIATMRRANENLVEERW